MRLPFALASYSHRVLPASAQRVINCFTEIQPETAKARALLLPTPGLVAFAEVDTLGVRGMHVMGGEVFSVIGNGVYATTTTGATRLIGLIAGSAPVSMDSDGENLCIVVPETGQGYVVDRATTTLTAITDADYPGATSVTVIDGYFVFTKPQSNEFFLSALNDPTAYDALDFASAEGAPDNLLAAMRVGRDLWLFGSRTIEIWSNTGATDFPFLRISGGFISRGTAAPRSIATRMGAAVWLGDDRVVYAAGGVQPQRISTHAIEQEFGGYSEVSDACAWIYEQDGHAFYVLTFPTVGNTWVYDFAAQVWHERESEGVGVWRAKLGCAFAGAVIAGDAVTGQIWQVNPVVMTEGGAQIIRVVTGTSFHAEGRQVWFSRLAAEFECGVGLGTGQGSSPAVWLAWSDDGGRTWSNDATASLGAQGVYRARTEWRRLGRARERVFRLQWADPVLTALISVNVDAESGDD